MKAKIILTEGATVDPRDDSNDKFSVAGGNNPSESEGFNPRPSYLTLSKMAYNSSKHR